MREKCKGWGHRELYPPWVRSGRLEANSDRLVADKGSKYILQGVCDHSRAHTAAPVR
jgi:hypothetical protein